MNSICFLLCITVVLLECFSHVKGNGAIKARKMKSFDLHKFKSFKKLSIKPFPVLQTRSASGSHSNQHLQDHLNSHKQTSVGRIAQSHTTLDKTVLKKTAGEKTKQNFNVSKYKDDIESGLGDSVEESGDNEDDAENADQKAPQSNLLDHYSDATKNEFLTKFNNAVETSKVFGNKDITSHLIENKAAQRRGLLSNVPYNTNLTIENSVHSYAILKSKTNYPQKNLIQQRGILSDAFRNANFSIQNSVHTYTVKKSKTKPKKEKLVRLDPVDVVGVKRDNDPIERHRNFLLKGKSASDVAAEIEMNDKALIPLLSNASPKELRMDAETAIEETQSHSSRAKFGLPFEGRLETNSGKRDDYGHHDDNYHDDHERADDNGRENTHYNSREGRYYPDSDEEYHRKDDRENFHDEPYTRDRGDDHEDDKHSKEYVSKDHEYHEPRSANKYKYDDNQEEEEEHFHSDPSYHHDDNDRDYHDDDRDHSKNYDDDNYDERRRDRDEHNRDYKEKEYHDASDKSYHEDKPKSAYHDDKCTDREKRHAICKNSGSDSLDVTTTSPDEPVLQFQRDSSYSMSPDIIPQNPAPITLPHNVVQIGVDSSSVMNTDGVHDRLRDDGLTGKRRQKDDDILSPVTSPLISQSSDVNLIDFNTHSPTGPVNSLIGVSETINPSFDRKLNSFHEDEGQKGAFSNDPYQERDSAFTDTKSKDNLLENLSNTGRDERKFHNKQMQLEAFLTVQHPKPKFVEFHQIPSKDKLSTLGSRRTTDNSFKDDNVFNEDVGHLQNEESYPYGRIDSRGYQSFHNSKYFDSRSREYSEKKNWFNAGDRRNQLNIKGGPLKSFNTISHVHQANNLYDSNSYPSTKHNSQMIAKNQLTHLSFHPIVKPEHLTATPQVYIKDTQTLRQRMSNGQEIELSNRDYADYYHEHLGEYLKQANYDYKILGLQMSDFGLEPLLSRRKFQNSNNRTLLTKTEILQQLHDNSSSSLITDLDNTTDLSDFDNDTVSQTSSKNVSTKLLNGKVETMNDNVEIINDKVEIGNKSRKIVEEDNEKTSPTNTSNNKNKLLKTVNEKTNLKQKSENINIKSNSTDSRKKEKHGVRKATIPKKKT